jgi:hypothetical protein
MPKNKETMPAWCREIMEELKRKRTHFRRMAARPYYDGSNEQKRRDQLIWRFEADGIDTAIKVFRKALKREYGDIGCS